MTQQTTEKLPEPIRDGLSTGLCGWPSEPMARSGKVRKSRYVGRKA
jgi:hypothetical protein